MGQGLTKDREEAEKRLKRAVASPGFTNGLDDAIRRLRDPSVPLETAIAELRAFAASHGLWDPEDVVILLRNLNEGKSILDVPASRPPLPLERHIRWWTLRRARLSHKAIDQDEARRRLLDEWRKDPAIYSLKDLLDWAEKMTTSLGGRRPTRSEAGIFAAMLKRQIERPYTEAEVAILKRRVEDHALAWRQATTGRRSPHKTQRYGIHQIEKYLRLPAPERMYRWHLDPHLALFLEEALIARSGS